MLLFQRDGLAVASNWAKIIICSRYRVIQSTNTRELKLAVNSFAFHVLLPKMSFKKRCLHRSVSQNS